MTPSLTFGMVPKGSADPTRTCLHALATALTETLGRPVEGVESPSYEGLATALDDGTVSMAWLPPVPALRRLGKGAIVCVALPVRHGASGYSAALFCRKDSPYSTVATLEGARVAWVDPESAAGHMAIRARLLSDGFDPDTIFSRQTFTGSHGDVVRAVLGGDADVGATFASVAADGSIGPAGWTGLAEGDELRIVLLQGPLPSDLVVAGHHLPPELLRPLREALVRPGEVARAAGALMRAQSFEEPSADHFEALQDLLEQLENDPISLRTGYRT